MKRRKYINKFAKGFEEEKREMPPETKKKIHKLLSNAMALSMTVSSFADYSVYSVKYEKNKKE